MFIRAIGVYQEDKCNPDEGLIKIKYAQQDKSVLFAANQLENVDMILLKSNDYKAIQPHKIYKFRKDDEYNYLYVSSSTKCILAISARTEADSLELAYLFKNIEHILIRPDIVGVTLDDIIANPLRFTRKEILIESVKENIDELKTLLHATIEKLILRGESLDQLLDKAIHLNDSATKFDNRAAKLNSCCRY